MGHRGQAAVALPTCQRKLLKKDDNSRKKAEGRTTKKEGRRQKEAPKSLPLILLLPVEANLHAPFKSIIVKYLFLNSPF